MKKTVLQWRERLLTSPTFHRVATTFPLTRPIVRKRQSELFDLVAGFVYSQILAAVVELDLLDHVAGRGKTISEIATLTGLGDDEARRLLDGAVSLRLLQKSGNRYQQGDLGSALAINPGVKAMIRHHSAFYKDMADPVGLLRKGRGETELSRLWDYALSDKPAQSTAENVSAYTTLMSESQAMVAAEILAVVSFEDHDVLLDVGGGDGTLLTAIGKGQPHLELQLFDLPAVADRASLKFQAEGLSSRARSVGGSFFDDELPQGADLASLVRILHDHDDGPALSILKAVYKALPKGGRLIVCEPMSTGGSAHRISDAYFNFYLYAMGSGRPRPPEMIEEMLDAAGFARVYRVPTRSPLITSILSAHK
ncbi:MAG: methyltransferase [Pseudomonadota bacterium]